MGCIEKESGSSHKSEGSYANILQCFFVVENFTANAVSDMAFSMLASYNVIYSCSLFFFVHYIICPSFYDLSDVVVVIV